MRRTAAIARTMGIILLVTLIFGGCFGRRNARLNVHTDSSAHTVDVLEIQTWNCGDNDDNVTATQRSDGALIVRGTGVMRDYDGTRIIAPWRDIQDSIISVIIEDSVTVIGKRAFSDLVGLTSITLPNSVISIRDFAFAGSASVTIPSSVISIGTGAFSRTASISVAADNPNYSSDDGVLFNKAKTVLIQYPQSRQETSYVVPSSVTSIGADAFANSRNLVSVTVGSSVTAIGAFAFAFCYSLESVTISNSVTEIGSGAFAHSGLTSVTSLNPIPPKITGTNPFFDINENACLYVQANSINAYRFAEHWKDFKCIEAISIVDGL